MALAKANLYQGSIRYCGDMMNFQKGKDSVHNEDLGYVMSIDGIRAISPAKDFITTIPVHHEKSLVDHEDKGSILVNGIVRKQEFDVSPILFEGQGDINRITNTHNQPFPLSGIFRNLPAKYQTKMNSHIRLILSIILLSLLSPSLLAQQANFDAYKAQYYQGAGNTVFNKGLKQTAPVSGFSFVLITGVKFKDCDKGVPTEKEQANLDRVSDSVYANVTRHVKNIMAGTFTYQCERLEYYYIVDTTNIRERLATLFQKYFSAYEAYINIKPDKDWDAYLKFLYPNAETLEYMQNEKILLALEKQGDKLEKARRVKHRINFTTEKDMDCFISYATQQGFKAETKGKDTKSELFKLHISRTDKVDLPSISTITTELRKEAKQCNGIYDGWETTVVK